MPFKNSLNLRILMQLQIGITNFISSLYCRGAGTGHGLALIFQTDKEEAKNQLILKRLFGIFNSSKKRTKTSRPEVS